MALNCACHFLWEQMSFPSLVGGPDGERVCLRVEDVLVQADQLGVIGKQQVEVLERLAQEEALHLVPGVGVGGVTDVADGAVPARGHLGSRVEQQ